MPKATRGDVNQSLEKLAVQQPEIPAHGTAVGKTTESKRNRRQRTSQASLADPIQQLSSGGPSSRLQTLPLNEAENAGNHHEFSNFVFVSDGQLKNLTGF